MFGADFILWLLVGVGVLAVAAALWIVLSARRRRAEASHDEPAVEPPQSRHPHHRDEPKQPAEQPDGAWPTIGAATGQPPGPPPRLPH